MRKGQRQTGDRQRLSDGFEHAQGKRGDGDRRRQGIAGFGKGGVQKAGQQVSLIRGDLVQRLRGLQQDGGGLPVAAAR